MDDARVAVPLVDPGGAPALLSRNKESCHNPTRTVPCMGG